MIVMKDGAGALLSAGELAELSHLREQLIRMIELDHCRQRDIDAARRLSERLACELSAARGTIAELKKLIEEGRAPIVEVQIEAGVEETAT